MSMRLVHLVFDGAGTLAVSAGSFPLDIMTKS